MTNEELPSWLQAELQSPVSDGDRNNQCMRLAPALLRAGMTTAETRAALVQLHPTEEFRIDRLIERAEKYAETERAADPEWQAKKQRADELTEKAQLWLPKILNKWQMPDLETDLPDLPPSEQRKRFIAAMFKPDDIIWIGEPGQADLRFQFRIAQKWLQLAYIPGEFISHSTYKPGTTCRNAESIAERRYLVLESDILEPSELAAVACYLRDHEKLELHAIVTTGGHRHAPASSHHWWFGWPGDSGIDDWAAVLKGYGADVATLRGPQPVRLPGCIRKSSGLPQQLLFLRK